MSKQKFANLKKIFTGLTVKRIECNTFIDYDIRTVKTVSTKKKDNYGLFGLYEGTVVDVDTNIKVDLDFPRDIIGSKYINFTLKDNEWNGDYMHFQNIIYFNWDKDELRLCLVGNNYVDSCSSVGSYIIDFKKGRC